MASITTIADDIDGSTPAETTTFHHAGIEYAIDLNEQHAKELNDLLEKHAKEIEKWTSIGRSLGRSVTPSKNQPSYDAAEVREWANAQGYDVAPRGRIPLDVIEAWKNRNKRKPQPTEDNAPAQIKSDTGNKETDQSKSEQKAEASKEATATK